MNIDPKVIDLALTITGTIFTGLVCLIVWIARGVTIKLDKVVENNSDHNSKLTALQTEMQNISEVMKEIPNIKEKTLRTELEVKMLKDQFSQTNSLVTNMTNKMSEIQRDILRFLMGNAEDKNNKNS